MFTIVLYQPEIPPNTGNIIRLCANTGAALHLVEPMGFAWDDRALRRAGLDYHEFASIQRHPDWTHCLAALATQPNRRLFAMTTKATRHYHTPQFSVGDTFIFGPESRGLPATLLNTLPPEQHLRLPMLPNRRSINLSNAVAITIYEAWRQQQFRGSC